MILKRSTVYSACQVMLILSSMYSLFYNLTALSGGSRVWKRITPRQSICGCQGCWIKQSALGVHQNLPHWLAAAACLSTLIQVLHAAAFKIVTRSCSERCWIEPWAADRALHSPEELSWFSLRSAQASLPSRNALLSSRKPGMSSQFKGVRASGSNQFRASVYVRVDSGTSRFELGSHTQERQAAKARDKYVVI